MRYDLTDFEWSVIEPLVPTGCPGPRRVDDRRILNGIFWVLRSGAPWRDLPERYPSWSCDLLYETATRNLSPRIMNPVHDWRQSPVGMNDDE